jgi:hypothetical protein
MVLAESFCRCTFHHQAEVLEQISCYGEVESGVQYRFSEENSHKRRRFAIHLQEI